MEAELAQPPVSEEVCPECGSHQLARDYVRGELVCESCGLVVNENYIDEGPEWTGTGPEAERKIRTGAPVNVASHDKGLTTEIASPHRDSQGRPLSSHDRLRMYRLRKLQRRMRYSRAGERSLAEALMEMDRMASQLGLPRQFRDEAALIYKKAAGRDIIRGRTIPGMAAASLYAACRLLEAPRTLEEIAEALGLEKRELALSYKALARELKLGLPPPRAEDFLGRFASRLDLPPRVENRALEIIREAERAERYHSKSPSGTVAAAIYLASILSEEKVPQAAIAEVAGVSEVTIRIRYRAISEKLGLDVSP